MKSVEQVRSDFPILKELIYLDSASTSLTPKQVVEAMDDYYLKYNSNIGRGAYRIAIKSGNKIEKTREKIANFINAEENEIIFTKNTTEAINTVANGLNFEKGDNIWISNMEHHSNLIPWLNLKRKGVEVNIVQANSDGIIEKSDIEENIDDRTKLVAITHISNSIGSIQDVEAIGKVAHENNSLFLVDGAQSLGHVKIDVKKINADFMAFPGHKGLLGPVGTGFLFLKEDIANELNPTNLGGGTITNVNGEYFTLENIPQRFEGGTQNISGIIGLGAAIDYINKIKVENIEKHCSYLTKKIWDKLSNIEGLILYGKPKKTHSIVSFNVGGVNPYDVAKILDETGNICVRSGFHCAIPGIKHLNADGTVRVSV
ncbi:MAG: cysteine desulfurase, partial [Methanobrevibacter sp.]|nr:cysteine desulfurase [Methanobrevibacter sp.]